MSAWGKNLLFVVPFQHLVFLPGAVKSKYWTEKMSTTNYCRQRSRSPRKRTPPPTLCRGPFVSHGWASTAMSAGKTDRQTDRRLDGHSKGHPLVLDVLQQGCSTGSLCRFLRESVFIFVFIIQHCSSTSSFTSDWLRGKRSRRRAAPGEFLCLDSLIMPP